LPQEPQLLESELRSTQLLLHSVEGHGQVEVVVWMIVAVVVEMLAVVAVGVELEGSAHANSGDMSWRLLFGPVPAGQAGCGPRRGAPFHITRNSPNPNMRGYASCSMSCFTRRATCPGTCSTSRYWSSDSRYAARPETVAAAVFVIIKYTRSEKKKVDNIWRNLPIDVPCCRPT
jgi:hypothetical protein